MHLLQAKM